MTNYPMPDETPSDRLDRALAALVTHGYYVTHTDHERDHGRPECRCCIELPKPTPTNYAVCAGGADTPTTASWLMNGGYVSWRGAAEPILDAFRDAGFTVAWDGTDDQCVMVSLPARDARRIATYVCASCEEYSCVCDEDEDEEEW